MKKRRGSDRKRLIALATALVQGGDLGAVLESQRMRPSQAVRALQSKNGLLVMREMRKLMALQRYLRLETTEVVMEVTCRRVDEAYQRGLAACPKRRTKEEMEAATTGENAIATAGGESFCLEAAMADLERRMDEEEG